MLQRRRADLDTLSRHFDIDNGIKPFSRKQCALLIKLIAFSYHTRGLRQLKNRECEPKFWVIVPL